MSPSLTSGLTALILKRACDRGEGNSCQSGLGGILNLHLAPNWMELPGWVWHQTGVRTEGG